MFGHSIGIGRSYFGDSFSFCQFLSSFMATKFRQVSTTDPRSFIIKHLLYYHSKLAAEVTRDL